MGMSRANLRPLRHHRFNSWKYLLQAKTFIQENGVSVDCIYITRAVTSSDNFLTISSLCLFSTITLTQKPKFEENWPTLKKKLHTLYYSEMWYKDIFSKKNALIARTLRAIPLKESLFTLCLLLVYSAKASGTNN